MFGYIKESKIVKAFMNAVEAKYPTAYVRKLSDRFSRGLPDIMIVFSRNDGEAGILFVETKRPDGVVSEIQKYEHDLIRQVNASGCEIMVATSVKEVLNKLEEMGADR